MANQLDELHLFLDDCGYRIGASGDGTGVIPDNKLWRVTVEQLQQGACNPSILAKWASEAATIAKLIAAADGDNTGLLAKAVNNSAGGGPIGGDYSLAQFDVDLSSATEVYGKPCVHIDGKPVTLHVGPDGHQFASRVKALIKMVKHERGATIQVTSGVRKQTYHYDKAKKKMVPDRSYHILGIAVDVQDIPNLPGPRYVPNGEPNANGSHTDNHINMDLANWMAVHCVKLGLGSGLNWDPRDPGHFSEIQANGTYG